MTSENKTFIHKYQPLYFKDFVPNDVIDLLSSLVSVDCFNVLLYGKMESGKTSLLNAVIREYYSGYVPKDYEENVLYINNLKEQGINYYRTDVKTFCQTCSAIKNKKKILILDDIDLINEQSQQVFRNCIDKYSHNVHFISSCSNIQKVIESIQSRFMIIKVQQLERKHLMNIVDNIKNIENFEIDKDAQEFIVNISNNTSKTLINYLEKFKLVNEKITLNLAMMLCSNISFVTLEEYTLFVLQGKMCEAINLIYEIYDKGYSVMDILDNYFVYIKNSDVVNEEQKYKIIPFICKYISIFHNIHEDEIELSLFTNNIIQILHS